MLNSKTKVFSLCLVILSITLISHFLIFEKFKNKNNDTYKASLIDVGLFEFNNKSLLQSTNTEAYKKQSFESYKKSSTYFKPETKEAPIKKTKLVNTKKAISAPKEDSDNPILLAHSILLKDLTSGEILMKRNELDSWPMASLTKLMTATIALENMDLTSKILITKNSADQSSNLLFKVGEYYSVIDMIKASLILSNNASALALAEGFGYEKFINLMQSKANFLGMKNSKFFEPTGLSPLNKSTALDFEILAKYIYTNHKEILDITTEKISSIKEITSGSDKVLNSTNIFAGENYFIGGKTGYTLEAQGNLFSIFKAGNKVLLSIVLGSKSKFEDTQKIYILSLRKLLGLSASK
ncbi:MAG: D-alanyl-D-alanine carboxypeptidase [Candidatus Pacebacteria bacterium]|nr:D-alanyl-D-alanine carboxypeptidase [Candidatus Paceibacterota bacterium]